jgi:hypothetical protein
MVGQLGAGLASFCFRLQPQLCVYYATDHNRYGDLSLDKPIWVHSNTHAA